MIVKWAGLMVCGVECAVGVPSNVAFEAASDLAFTAAFSVSLVHEVPGFAVANHSGHLRFRGARGGGVNHRLCPADSDDVWAGLQEWDWLLRKRQMQLRCLLSRHDPTVNVAAAVYGHGTRFLEYGRYGTIFDHFFMLA